MPTARRFIDPNTRDYVLTMGEYEADIGVTSKVYSRIATRRGSVIVLPSFGSELHTIKGPFAGWDTLAERFVKNCLDDIVKRREVNRLKVKATRGGNVHNALLDLDVEYFDRRGRRQQVRYTHGVEGT